MAPNPRTMQLWRRCLRCCKEMEGAMGNYYHGFAREHIVAHKEEDNPERLEQLLGRGEQNLRFVLRKYRMTEPRRPEQILTKTPNALRRASRGAGVAGSGEDADRTWTPGR